jgi:hypothetical protein
MSVTSRLPYRLQGTAPTDGRTVRGVDLTWSVPVPGYQLQDGTRLEDALAAATNTWRRRGGQIRLQRLDVTWAWFADDLAGPGPGRSPETTAALVALAQHACARALTAGLCQPYLLDDDPAANRVGCHLAVADAGVVLMAALDLHLTGSHDLIGWYLSSPCSPWHCRHHTRIARTAALFPGRTSELILGDIPAPRWRPAPPGHPQTKD